MVRRNEIDDIDLSIRFKFGVHTIFLFVDASSHFSDVSSELLEVLQERFPDGLKADKDSPPTALPDDSSQIEFAVLRSQTDPSLGWIPLHAKSDDTPVGKGLKDNQTVAFAFRDAADEDFGEVVFEVAFPTYEEEMEE
ncbi:hypothetical protein JX265_007361 [Neoarthrinium moseri]|uniref:Uncharacterized protein n=1 Tax=Neoarthrinium moseri TaxID=1658444 RepID=A0A9Q0ANP7_9PEZI|nr:uncharacterized protein JN550_009085 [Neoarthrinium moseri]KAI1843577.1 hypothetical protein JX266_010210 [Neoarthrinium moseri]KAI1864065.1 hypothetical protein JN550_009085 [Neoarthrinium moseri]KAI1867559.1 hypothetical protein JX265_007361 [Neoarthrinium moseri]